LELRGRRYRDRQAQGRGVEGILRDGRSRLWRDPATGLGPDRYKRYRGHERRRAGIYSSYRDAHDVLPVAAVQDWHGDDAGRAGDPEAGTTLGAISISPCRCFLRQRRRLVSYAAPIVRFQVSKSYGPQARWRPSLGRTVVRNGKGG